MRMSDQEYFRSCIAKERHLAQLLGHDNIEEFYESAGVLWDHTQALPKWTRDWKACGPLLVQYAIPLHFHHEAEAGETAAEGDSINAVTAGPVTVHFADHPGKDRAVMFAVVKAVIHILEHESGHRHHVRHHHANVRQH